MNPRVPRLILVSALLACLVPTTVLADPAAELDRAYDALQQSTYRKRDIVTAYAGLGSGSPAVTEYAHGRTRMVVDSDVPPYGRIRQERVTVGSRAAVRTIAPGVKNQLEQARRRTTLSSAGTLLNQAASIGAAAATGGLSSASLITSAIGTVGSVAATTRARSAINQTTASFGTWQLVEESDDEFGEAAFPDADVPGLPRSSDDVRVEKSVSRDGRIIKYTKRVLAPSPAGEVETVVTVNAATGLPMAEETFVNRQRMARTEYFDVGAPIVIELPDILR